VLYHLTDLDAETMRRLRPTEVGTDRTLAAYEETATVNDASDVDDASDINDASDVDDASGVNDLSDASDASDTSDVSTVSNGIVDYLRHGLSDNVAADSGYLAEHRTPWYVVDRREPPAIVVTYMSRGGSRFIQNETDARTLSNLHGLYLDVDLSNSEQKALLAYLNSGFASEVVRRSGRTYSSGMDKIEPNELEGVPVLDPRRLDGETVDGLAERFDHLRRVAREDGPTEAATAALDELLDRIR